jgi:RecA-family ATPase
MMDDMPDYLEPGDDDSFALMLEAARRKRPAADGKDRPETVADLPLVTASSLAGKPVPSRRWIVQDMIPDRNVTMLSGDGAVGKSTLLLQLGVAVATGREWIGASPEKGSAVFLAAEDDMDELHRRLRAIVASMAGLSLGDLGNLHLIPLAGRDAVMGAPEGKSSIIRPTAVFRGLVKHVETIKPRLVILEPLSDIFAGNENARPEARQFIGLFSGLAIDHSLAVALAAHPSLYGMSSGTGTSGSTAWGNSVRARLYLETIKGDDGREIDASLRVLRVKKSNYGPPGLELRLRWSNGVFLLDGPAGGFDKLAAEATAEGVFLDLLGMMQSQGRDVSPNPSKTYAPTVFEKHPNAEGIRKEAFERAMERLLRDERLHVEPFGPPSKQRKRLVIYREKEGAEC